MDTQHIEFEKIFKFELVSVPRSFFHESGYARYTTSKSGLINKLKVEESSHGVKPDAVVTDGGGMLHKV